MISTFQIVTSHVFICATYPVCVVYDHSLSRIVCWLIRCACFCCIFFWKFVLSINLPRVSYYYLDFSTKCSLFPFLNLYNSSILRLSYTLSIYIIVRVHAELLSDFVEANEMYFRHSIVCICWTGSVLWLSEIFW